MDDDAEHQHEQDEVAGFGVAHPLVEVGDVRSGRVGGEVQVGVEHRERAAAQQPLDQAHSEQFVQAAVALPPMQRVVALGQPWPNESAHDAEPGHG